MELFLSYAASYWWAVLVVLLVLFYKITFRIFGIVIIPDDSVGIVKKKFVLFGTNDLPTGEIVARHGEAGLQANLLSPGIHYAFWPWQYEIRSVKFTVIPDGMFGTVDARGGMPIESGRILGRRVESSSFQSVEEFLTKGGERGPQITVIPPGVYRINTDFFTVTPQAKTEVPSGKIGIVTTREGKALPSGEIAGAEIKGHSSYQNAQAFIDAGGNKGLQEQVILPGTYFINPLFARVEMVDLTEVPIANAGVVISYIGELGTDVTGDDFKHGNLVKTGCRGVWSEPLDPGKYPINTKTHKVENVSSANIVLNWANTKSEAHNLDRNLSTITARSSDGFTFNLDVSQIIHIPRNDAPKVIARFGNMENLVTQVLEPIIGNYFRNAAQDSDVIDFLTKRSTRQEDAKKLISAALLEYNVGAVDTLIGDIVPPEALMKTLTDRKIAAQEEMTYKTQCSAEDGRKLLEQARASADTQASVVTAERSAEISKFNASAKVAEAKGDAESKTINAEADAKVLVLVGEAEGKKISAVGLAEAEVIKLKVSAVGSSDNYAMIQVGCALAENKVKLVPEIMVNGSAENNGGLVNAFLGSILAKDKKSE